MMYDIMDRDGKLVTYPDYAPSDVRVDLELIAGKTPMALTVSVSDRGRLIKLVKHSRCLIDPSTKDLIEHALQMSKRIARPIRVPTDYEKLAYVDEKGELICIKDVDDEVGKTPNGEPVHLKLTAGERYKFKSRALGYILPYTKTKMSYDEEARTVKSRVHEMSLEGQDYALTFEDDRGWRMNFRDHPMFTSDIDESLIWEYFGKPDIPTLADDHKEEYDQAIHVLKCMEQISDFTFYPNQMEYIAQACCASSAQIAAETGCGKTLIAIALIMLKQAGRVMICAPKGTVKDSDGNKIEAPSPSQWVSEFKKFAPDIPVYKIFGRHDHDKLIERYGELPYGVFLTYDYVMFRNGLEQKPAAWNNQKLDDEELYRKHLKGIGIKVGPYYDEFGHKDLTRYSDGLGQQRVLKVLEKGYETGQRIAIKCVSTPCLATEIGPKFWDMVILDEAHLICNLDSQITQNFIRLQPKYRFALTATPIPNMVWNIFSLMGWLCVDDWYHGDKMNARWPYRLTELSAFKKEFVSRERDKTIEAFKKKYGKGPNYLKFSPTISQPTKLLKLLRPTVAFISKAQCNPNLPGSNVMDIRVPMTFQQRQLYSHFMDPGNVDVKSAQFRYGVQMAYLRGICAAPKSCDYNYICTTDFNPKTVAILETIYKHISKGEQVIHVSARHGMTDEIEKRLGECGVKTSRIDGSVKDHALEAAKFKRGDTQVLLMGINCAQAHSFEQCRNLIVGSLEWSYGKFNQALGRIYRLTSPQDVNVYVILHKNSIEELMFDKLGTKEDAATICLHGKRVPRDVNMVDAQEILAEHVTGWESLDKGIEVYEADNEEMWPQLRDRFLTITHGKKLGITKTEQDAVSALIEEMNDYETA
jgi:hypothetical protein